MRKHQISYLVVTETDYSQRLLYNYMEEVKNVFDKEMGEEVYNISRPFGAISFQPNLQKIREKYLNPREKDNLEKLNANLYQIQNIMQRNIEQIMDRGEKMEHVESKSRNLLENSKR